MIALLLSIALTVTSGALCLYMIIRTRVIFQALDNHKKHIDAIIKRQDDLDKKWQWLSGNYDKI